MLYQVAETCTNEPVKVGKRPAWVSLMCLAEFVVLGSPSPTFLLLSHRRTTRPPLHIYPSVSQPRLSTCPGTYVWLREMLSCISSRMFDGALLFKHGPRHHGWAVSTNLHTFARGIHVLTPRMCRAALAHVSCWITSKNSVSVFTRASRCDSAFQRPKG